MVSRSGLVGAVSHHVVADLIVLVAEQQLQRKQLNPARTGNNSEFSGKHSRSK